ncbi:MAG: DUF1080 domain-containing protein [Candidatus Hydrogenedens sp.]|nr:DUF1080 domain-containing protein [Candidatus Hydrogenedens sp.]
MTGYRTIVLACALILFGATCSHATDAPEGFSPLFNGADFSGWEGNEAFFRVEEQAVVAGRLSQPIPKNQFLCTEREYGDFELRLQAKASQDDVNGGIQIRSQRIPNHHEVKGYQVDIGVVPVPVMRMMFDAEGLEKAHLPAEGAATIWGSLYDESRRNKYLAVGDMAETAKAVTPTEWNDFVIRCEGPRIQVWVNGIQTVDYTESDDAIPRAGLIGLQIHSGPASEVAYRNLYIKPLPEANGDAER